jgi:hypothetical protein
LRVLKADKMALEPQTLLRGDTLDVEGEVFSELDATLMVQLLLHNTTLTRIDLSGTRPLPREIKLLSDGFGRCKFPLRELSVNGRTLGLESCASLLEPLRTCPLELLELRKNDICGVRPTGREPFSTYVLKIVCEMIVRPGGGLLKLNLQENNLLGNDVYSSEAVSLLVEALKSPHCRLQELHLGLLNQQHGMHERDASVLGEAVRACTSLKALSITGALLPMSELLNSTICLDLAGKGLGRVEMGIAAQLLHKNSLLQVLKLSDNPIGQFGMEALADAVAHAQPPLVEAHLGNLGIRSGGQIQRFLVALRSYRAPLRVLDLHRNCLLPPLGEDIVDPQAWLRQCARARPLCLGACPVPPVPHALPSCTRCALLHTLRARCANCDAGPRCDATLLLSHATVRAHAPPQDARDGRLQRVVRHDARRAGGGVQRGGGASPRLT